MDEIKERWYQMSMTLEEAESFIQENMVSAVRSYVATGYYLRRIRDDKLYQESGYDNFEAYVENKYDKDKGWASKCIRVNQELSIDGDTPNLDKRYLKYSTYQLVELSYLDDEQRNQTTPDMTVKQIREARKPEKVVTSQLPEEQNLVDEEQPAAETQQIVDSVAISQQEELTPDYAETEDVIDGDFTEVKDSEPEEVKQPELPILKNNDQRAAFVDAYESWPLWIETLQTGERYYRYDLADGTSMVVKVYHSMLFDYKEAETKWEDRYSEGWGKHEYYLLQEGNFFRDCDCNRSLLIEKLKEIQKK